MSIDDQIKRLRTKTRQENKVKNKDFKIYNKCYEFPMKLGEYVIYNDFVMNKIVKLYIKIEEEISVRDMLFFDTETTGLSSGAGTIPFLVGFGYLDDNGFQIKQFFLKELSSEYSMLQKIKNIFGKFKYLVSYNGKSFDIHILETRYILNRIDIEFTNIPHIDLLYPCRAFYRKRIGSAALQDIEREIIKYKRSDDIMSSLIPYIYFDYLRRGQDSRIDDVIRHNRYDILSLLFILYNIENTLSDPNSIGEEIDKLSIAKYLKNKKLTDDAEIHIKCLLENCIDKIVMKEAKREKSFMLKRKNINAAASIWEEEQTEFYAIVELAKYYEHKVKDLNTALEIVQSGIEKCNIINELNECSGRMKYFEDLIKRKKRILNKIRRRIVVTNS